MTFVTKEEYEQELTIADLEYYLYKCFQIGYYEGKDLPFI